MARASRKEPLGFGDRIDKLGTYFVYHNVLERHKVSFEKFLAMVEAGTWQQFIKERVG